MLEPPLWIMLQPFESSTSVEGVAWSDVTVELPLVLELPLLEFVILCSWPGWPGAFGAV